MHFEEDDTFKDAGFGDHLHQGVGRVETVEDRPKKAAASTGGAQAPPSFDVLKRAAEEAKRATQPAPMTGTDTEPDSDAAPSGAGHRGQGAPLMVGAGLGRRVISDGAGLCSPGVWPPHDRPFPRHWRLQAVRSAILRALATLNGGSNWVERTFDMLSRGEIKEDPFPSHQTASLVHYIIGLYDDEPEMSARPRGGDIAQQVRVRLLQCLLRDAEDPDWRGMNHLARGIRLGVRHRLPRTPAVYSRKRRWRLEGQADRDAWKLPSVDTVWRDNYRSAAAHHRIIEAQLDDLVAEGRALRLDPASARQRFPDLIVSSLGAVEKKRVGDSGEVELDVRVVQDGTHGVGINGAIRVRDQDACPMAADIKRLQRSQARHSRRPRGLAADFKSAHRLPMVHPEDWRYQGCRARSTGDVYVIKCGVFGISSISYWWSRMGGAAVRAVHYASSRDMELWMQLFADDLKVESTSINPSSAIIWVLWLLVILGFPLKWRKAIGGDVIPWIGYEVLCKELALGITESRSSWAVGWLRRIIRDRVILVAEFRSELGRLSFTAGALEYDRAFLAPFYSFLATCKDCRTRYLPRYVATAAEYLAMRLEKRRAYPSAIRRRTRSTAPRVDARADQETIGIGGWEPFIDESGSIVQGKSRWFAFNLTRANAGWAYARNGQPFRTIAALEAFGVLAALLAFFRNSPLDEDAQLQLPMVTDNQGNESALSRLASNRFPLSIVVMEIAAQLEVRRARLSMTWTPRDSNSEADQLSNGDFTGFDPSLRVPIHPESVQWLVLDRLMSHALEFERTRTRGRDRSA